MKAAAAEVAGELRGADGSAAARGGGRDLHQAGQPGRDSHRSQPVVPGGEEASGLYLRLVVDTGRGWLTAYLNGGVPMRRPYKPVND